MDNPAAAPKRRRGLQKTGFDDFLDVLKKFRGLSATALAASAAVPFAAYVANIAPPWPPGVMLVTALLELVTLILVFQFFRPAPRRTINKVLAAVTPLLLLVSATYVLGFALFTYHIPATNGRSAIGFICRNDIPNAAKDECPFLSPEFLKDAAYTAELLWVNWTIQVTRFGLALLWLASFMLLSAVIGTFLVYQTKVRSRVS